MWTEQNFYILNVGEMCSLAVPRMKLTCSLFDGGLDLYKVYFIPAIKAYI